MQGGAANRTRMHKYYSIPGFQNSNSRASAEAAIAATAGIQQQYGNKNNESGRTLNERYMHKKILLLWTCTVNFMEGK